MQEFNGKLYVVVCTGSTDTLNEETGTMRSFAIYVGENHGDATNKADWTWRPLVGDTAKGAKYYYGLDKSRVSAGACTCRSTATTCTSATTTTCPAHCRASSPRATS